MAAELEGGLEGVDLPSFEGLELRDDDVVTDDVRIAMIGEDSMTWFG
jgi:hypothetical protein